MWLTCKIYKRIRATGEKNSSGFKLRILTCNLRILSFSEFFLRILSGPEPLLKKSDLNIVFTFLLEQRLNLSFIRKSFLIHVKCFLPRSDPLALK